jgi:hypothetical protein
MDRYIIISKVSSSLAISLPATAMAVNEMTAPSIQSPALKVLGISIIE